MPEFEVGTAVRLPSKVVPVYRVLGRNAGPMTGPGTNSYLIGEQNLELVDPGPADEQHTASLLKIIGDRSLDYILVTHTHGDHSPGAQLLRNKSGAQLIGMSPPDDGRQDLTFNPDQIWAGGESIHCQGFTIDLIHTPGHVSNHLCYLLPEEGILFTGEHVLQGTTPVILPPDGDMSHYMDSLRRLQDLSLTCLCPGHGDVMIEPQRELNKLIRHRLHREHKVIAGLQALGRVSIETLVMRVYDDVAEHLIPWATKTVLAHLLKLKKADRVSETDGIWALQQCPQGNKMLSLWTLYLIRFGNQSLYTGITTDVERRFEEHKSGGPKAAKSIRGRGPLQLEFSVQVGDRSKATALEMKVKKLSRQDKEKLVAGQLSIFDLD